MGLHAAGSVSVARFLLFLCVFMCLDTDLFLPPSVLLCLHAEAKTVLVPEVIEIYLQSEEGKLRW